MMITLVVKTSDLAMLQTNCLQIAKHKITDRQSFEQNNKDTSCSTDPSCKTMCQNALKTLVDKFWLNGVVDLERDIDSS